MKLFVSKKLVLPVIFLCSVIPGNSQVHHRIMIKLSVPDKGKSDSTTYFLASDKNQWNPGDSTYRFEHTGQGYQISIPFDDSLKMQFKITRGNWARGESDEDGYGAPNRELAAYGDTAILVKVLGWTDLIPRKHTASPNVHLLVDSFPMPSLHSTRRIWIYLPASYSRSHKRYPVIYMQDGQNLFDRATTAFGKEWKVDETMDSLISSGKREYIIVGIESGEKRLQEYLPYQSSHIQNPEGKLYAEFMIRDLIPYVDMHYRTLKDAANRSVAGSSMGALISLYTVLNYPKTFHSGGIFSCSYWVVDQFEKVIVHDKINQALSVFLYAGDSEMQSLIGNTDTMANLLRKNPGTRVKTSYVVGGQHSERYWQKPFMEYILWLQQ
jgi:predicted alpha/beta superfamily hydrolase